MKECFREELEKPEEVVADFTMVMQQSAMSVKGDAAREEAAR